MAAGALVTVAGSFLPWVRTGGKRRNSYDLFAIVERLGFAPGDVAATALRWWPLVPLLAVVAIVLAWSRLPRLGGAVGVGGSLYAGGTAFAVILAPSVALVDLQVGPAVTVVGSLALLAGSIAVLVAGPRTDPVSP